MPTSSALRFMVSSGLWLDVVSSKFLFQHELRAAIENIVRPVHGLGGAHGLAGFQDGRAEGFPRQDLGVESLGKGGSRCIADRPVGADVVGRPAAQKRLGQTDVLFEPLAGGDFPNGWLQSTANAAGL